MTVSHNLDGAALDLELKALLADVLGLDPEQAHAFGPDTGLFGHLPELDSMAVAGLLTEMEDRLGIVIEDDDVDGERSVALRRAARLGDQAARDMLLRYNEDDCRATRAVRQFLSDGAPGVPLMSDVAG